MWIGQGDIEVENDKGYSASASHFENDTIWLEVGGPSGGGWAIFSKQDARTLGEWLIAASAST